MAIIMNNLLVINSNQHSSGHINQQQKNYVRIILPVVKFYWTFCCICTEIWN